MHDTTVDGESTEKWAIRSIGFFGSVKQLTCCARCGEELKVGPSLKRKVFNNLKPDMHFLCDACFDALPD